MVFDRVASCFRDLRTTLSYDENSEEANNLEITFLQGLYEKLENRVIQGLLVPQVVIHRLKSGHDPGLQW